MKRYIILFSASLCLSSSSFAMFCPTNFNSIKIGDPVELVELQCGKPDQKTKTKVMPDPNDLPQEWIYLVKTNPDSPNSMRISIIFQNKKSTSIAVNGAGIGVTSLCNNATIQIGDTMDIIKKACGSPALVNQANSPGQTSQAKEKEIIELKYTSTPTPMTLIFEDGSLKEKK